MTEKLPIPEGSKPVSPEEQKSDREIIKGLLENFLARPDDPGVPYEAQNRLQKESRHNPEAAEKFIESKKSKYRLSALNIPLAVAKDFLESPKAKNIDSDKRQELIARVEKSYKDMDLAREKKLLIKEEVDAVVDIAKEILSYLES